MPTYTTEINQSLPFSTTPVGQELIVALSSDLCVANEQNVKFCFKIAIGTYTTSLPLIGIFKTTPNNFGAGILNISNLLQNYVSPDNLATSSSTFKIDGAWNNRPVPIHLIDKFSRAKNSVKSLNIAGYTEYTDSTGTVIETDLVFVAFANTIINAYIKDSQLLSWVSSTNVGDAFGFGFNLEPYAIRSGKTNKFLSNSPSTQYARWEDYGTMSFLAIQRFAGTSEASDVKYCKISMFDSSDSSLGEIEIQRNVSNGAFNGTTGMTNDSKNNILYIGAFPANLRVNTTFNNQINSLAYYTVGLYGLTSNLISEVKRVDILCPNLKGYTPVRLTWLNQWGTWDYFTFNQKSVKSISTKGTTYQQLGGTWNSQYYEPYGYKGGKKTFRVNASETIKMNTDYITEEHSEWFEELINSPEIYILKDWKLPRTINGSDNIMELTTQYLTPVTLKTKSLTKKTVANDRLIQYTFEVEKSRNLRTQAI